MQIYRQGDVLVSSTTMTAIPKGAKRQKLDKGRVVLAYGEVTGHAHALSGKLVSMYEWQGDTLIEVKATAPLQHEEHATITLEPGIYKVTRQREYTPEAIRWVAD